MIQTTTLRPGLLVSLKTHIQGNVRYSKRTIETAHLADGGIEREVWETERTIADPVELEAAKKARSKASNLIRGICAQSAFGLLCPETNEENLEKAIAEARSIADEFNATARLSRISVYVITGRIAPDDVEAMRAINSEVRDLLSEMARGVNNLDPKVIREAADKARQLGAMLSPQAEARIREAIDMVRKTARQIVKAGETAAEEVDRSVIRRITDLRTSFLDLDEQREIATPQAEGRAVDFEPEPELQVVAPTSAPQIEVEEEEFQWGPETVDEIYGEENTVE